MPTPPCNPPTRRQRERGSATAPLGPVAYTPARGWVYHVPLWWYHEGGRQPPRAADARPQKRCVTGGIAKAPTVAAMRTMTAKFVRTWVVLPYDEIPKMVMRRGGGPLSDRMPQESHPERPTPSPDAISPYMYGQYTYMKYGSVGRCSSSPDTSLVCSYDV